MKKLLPCLLPLLASPELAAVFSKREAGHDSYNKGQTWAVTNSRGSGRPFDGLLRADLTVWRGRWGRNGSYAGGGVSCLSGLVGGSERTATNCSLRLGVVYRLGPGTLR